MIENDYEYPDEGNEGLSLCYVLSFSRYHLAGMLERMNQEMAA